MAAAAVVVMMMTALGAGAATGALAALVDLGSPGYAADPVVGPAGRRGWATGGLDLRPGGMIPPRRGFSCAGAPLS